MFWANCGIQIPDGSNFCTNCGAEATTNSQSQPSSQAVRADNGVYSEAHSQAQKQPEKISFWQTGWFTLLMLLCVPPVGILLLWRNGGKITRIILVILAAVFCFAVLSSLYISLQLQGRSSKIGPPEQIAFHQQMKAFGDKYKVAQNEINKSAVRREMARFIREYFTNGEVKDWEGKIERIETTKDGGGASLEIDCNQGGYNIKFKTESIYSARSDTILKLGSPVYNALANMKERDKVKFSATLLPDEKYGFKVSQSLYMDELEFIVIFTSVTSL